MRRRSWLRALLAGSILAVSPAAASANWFGHFHRTVYVAPANYVETFPTYSVLPTAYYPVTAYGRVAYPTAVVVPYRAVYPSSFAYPAAAYAPVGGCCDPCATAVASAPVQQAGAVAPRPPVTKPAGPSSTSATPAAPPTYLESRKPDAAEPLSSEVGMGETTETRNTGQSPPAPTSVADPKVAPVPTAPAPEAGKDGSLVLPLEPGLGTGTGAGAGGDATPITPAPPAGTPPKAPDGETSTLDVPAVPNLGAVNREAMKPSATNPVYRRSTLKGDLNELGGRVVANGSRAPEPGVSVTFLNKKTSALRSATTDAGGRYQVRLPDGDWVAQVTTARGRTYPVGDLIVRGGQIRDDFGRDVPSLNITR